MNKLRLVALLSLLIVALGGIYSGATQAGHIAAACLAPQTQPNANNDNGFTLSGVQTNLLVLNNDTGSNLSLTIVQAPTQGVATVFANSSIKYTPSAIFAGTDTLRYRITDLTDGLYDEAQVIITVANNPAITVNANVDELIMQPNQTATIPVLSNDAGSGVIVSSITVAPAHGTASITNGGTTVSYTPNAGYEGSDTFSYQITGNNGATDVAAVSISVTSNLPPNVNEPLRFCTPAFTPVTICDTWTDPNTDPVHIDIDASGTTFHCSLNLLNDSCLRYTPLPGFVGIDTVAIVVCDDHVPAACSTSIVLVNVGACPMPIANADLVIIDDNLVTINGNGSTVTNAFDAAPLAVALNDMEFCAATAQADYLTQQPAHGTAAVINGQIVYNANNGYVGNDVLKYAVCNSCGQCDTTTVNIQIMSMNGGGGTEPPSDCDNPTISVCKPPFTNTSLCPSFCKFPTGGINTINATTSIGTITPTGGGCFNFVPPALFNATANITFIACGNGGVCDTALAVVTIDPNCGTNPPQAQADNASTQVNQTAIIDVLANDLEPDGQTPAVTQIISQPACGSASIVGNQIVYTPTDACVGTQTLTYAVCDPTNLCDTATVTIQVINPQPANDCDNQTEYCTPIFTSVTICVDFCNLVGFDDVIIVDAGTTFHCSINVLNDSCIRYTPLPGFVGTDSVFVYGCANNGNGMCDTIAVGVHVGCGSPIAVDDQANAVGGTSTNINILGNDYDTCADNDLVPSILQSAQHGVLTLNSNGTVSYTPNEGFVGTDIVTYQACILCAQGPICEPATLLINVSAEPPQSLDSQPDVVQISYNTATPIAVLSNDLGSGLVVTATTQPQHGQVVLNGNIPTYTPTTGYTGTDAFLYTVCDDTGACEQNLVSITVLPSTVPVIANNDQVSTPLNTPISINIRANDQNIGNDNNVELNSLPANGILILQANGNVYYDPNNGFEGIETFTYTICNNETQLCDQATVTILVGNIAANAAPIAQNDELSVPLNTPTNLLPLANDSDPNPSDQLAITLFTNPLHGNLTEQGDTLLTYTPDPNYEGMDYFTYIVCDNGLPVLCDTAYVSLSVGDTNLPPIAAADTVYTVVGQVVFVEVTLNDTDPDHAITQLIATAISNPANGQITASGGSNGFNYTPNAGFIGTDTFSYQICDPLGKCDTALITVVVLPDIDAQPDLVTTNEGAVITFEVMGNDVGEGISVTSVVTLPQNGAITAADGITGTFTYQPAGSFNGNDYFEYVICDTYGACDTTVVSITVLPNGTPNLAPQAGNDVAATVADSTIVINVLNNDSDPNNDPLTVTAISQQPTNGTATLNPDGTITYQPTTTEPSCNLLAYVVCDNADPALCDTALVQISIGIGGCNNQAPIATDDQAITQEDSPVDIYVTYNDLLSPDDSYTLAIGSQPMHGTLSQFADIVTYTPAEDYTGSDFFTYIICNQNTPNLCDTAYVSINVLPQSVDAQPDIIYTNANTAVGIAAILNDLGTNINITDIVTEPGLGELLVNFGSNIIIYTPNLGISDTVDVFEYQICDGSGACDVTLVTIYILPQTSTNLPPTAVNDAVNTPLNTPIVIDVAGNDFDSFGGDQLLVVIETQPAHGTANLNEDGTVSYTPNNAYSGIDEFSYIVCDNASPVLCDTAVVVITVGDINPSNVPPVAEDDYATTFINTPMSINLLDNDSDPDNDAINIVWLNEALHGTANLLPNGTLEYAPNSGFQGNDYLTYIICDNGNPTLCDTAYVTITVQGEIPDTVYVATETPEDTPVTNCLDGYLPSGFAVDTLVVIGLPSNGSIVLDSSCVQYLPNPNYNGSDQLILQACDANGICIPVVLAVNVTPVPEAPIAQNDTTQTPINTPLNIAVLDNDSDPDGDAITAVLLVTEPAQPNASLSYDAEMQVFNYTPPTDFVGTDSFAYVITDAVGLLSDTAWVYINVIDDDTTQTEQLTALADAANTDIATPVEVAVLGNDAIPIGQTNITLINISSPANGSVVINPNSITYIPNITFVGIDTFSYQICATYPNGDELCDTALVSINVLPTDTEECGTLETANAFSPNGDSINDLLLISNIDNPCRSQQSMSIFNRWGDAVYNAPQYDNSRAWNGRWQNSGSDLPDGTYFYIITYLENDTEQKINGFVELRR